MAPLVVHWPLHDNLLGILWIVDFHRGEENGSGAQQIGFTKCLLTWVGVMKQDNYIFLFYNIVCFLYT